MARRKKKKHSHVDESWLLPYSDLLTLLVALFIVLFASSEIDVQKYTQMANVFRSEFSGVGEGILDNQTEAIPPSVEEGRDDGEHREEEEQEPVEEEDDETQGERELEELREIQEEINAYIEAEGLINEFGTELTGEGLLITMRNDILFDSGSAEVRSDGRAVAADVANLLYTEPPHQIVISGHADDVPIVNASYSSNWELSVARAVNFMTILLENQDLDPTLFSAKGHGEFDPIVPNDTAEHRAQNRRVEVLVLPNYEINLPSEE
ncbi:flagellar motor protein MotB [Gracilibacillus alcaliphilus]|uniref:flagellar motor protein MotB n=1 Tax=Gracilibacillus alcaliphilus TaxID=1401441 RepID=UPI00195B826C|nr:flagellar motor protein MotB [Gracilibacillus alcaliphilus]MBM7679766.1 chemotaxis protein MotB [Gracilibacillus alcaliphilus]